MTEPTKTKRKRRPAKRISFDGSWHAVDKYGIVEFWFETHFAVGLCHAEIDRLYKWSRARRGL